jgi:hypothetical protein
MEMWWEKIEMACEHFLIRFLPVHSLVGVLKKTSSWVGHMEIDVKPTNTSQ